jgi:voltage-gated potassium channel
MTAKPAQMMESARRRRRAALGVLRSLTTIIVLVGLYYLLPLTRLASVPLAVTLVAGLLVLLAVAVWQLRQIGRDRYPVVRAGVALATTVPLFLLLFASAYFVMARDNPANFNTHSLTRTDSLFFTVATFSTVGYGDITAASQAARLVVTAQIILDLLALGLGIRVFLGTVQRARQEPAEAADPAASPERNGSPQRELTTIRFPESSGQIISAFPETSHKP